MGDHPMGATQYVAFLRAVNVGGRIVKMTELKRIFEAAGLDEVSTFIASGNVIFRSARSADKLAPHIEGALQKALGYTVTTILRTAGEVAAVAGYEAYPPAFAGGASIYVGLMQTRPAAAAVKKALALQTEIDQLRIARAGGLLAGAEELLGSDDHRRGRGEGTADAGDLSQCEHDAAACGKIPRVIPQITEPTQISQITQISQEPTQISRISQISFGLVFFPKRSAKSLNLRWLLFLRNP